jgi:uncharacterized protein YdaU (DUF1376 family)
MNPPWMPLYIADYRADTAHLSASEHGAYLLLIMHYWQTGGLPDDDRQLARICCMTPAQWKAARPIISTFFHDGWRHKRIDAELSHAADVIEKRKAAVAQREIKRRTSDASNDLSSDASKDDTRARASPSPSPSPSHSSLRSEKKETRASALGVPAWPPDFREQFWEAFPNKVGKADAVRKLETIKKRGSIAFSELMAGLGRYVAKTDDRPWCNPATWLHQQRWTDQPATVARSTNGQHKRTVHEAADDLLDKLRSLDAPAPGDLRDGTGKSPVRQLPPR